MSLPPAVRRRLNGIVAAIRFAWIPVVCAAFLALAGGAPRGRLVALASAAMALAVGVALHAEAIVHGRSDESLPSADDAYEIWRNA